MALKFKLDTLEGLDETTKTFYKPGPDGKGFVLDMDDDPAKETIAKIRGERDELAKALRAHEKAEADAKAVKDREDLERKGEYEKLSAADKAALKAAEERVQNLESKFRMSSRERFLQEAMAAVGAIPEALGPHVRDLFEDVPDGDGFKHVVKGDAGKKAADFLAAFKETKPWAFQPTGSTGGGASTHQGAPGTPAKARFAELMAKPNLTPAESHEIVRLGNEIDKPATK